MREAPEVLPHCDSLHSCYKCLTVVLVYRSNEQSRCRVVFTPEGQLAGQSGRTVRFHVSFITVANDP